jgi:hypothetical protein
VKPDREAHVELPDGYGLVALSTALNGPHEVTVREVASGAVATCSDLGGLQAAADRAVGTLRRLLNG